MKPQTRGDSAYGSEEGEGGAETKETTGNSEGKESGVRGSRLGYIDNRNKALPNPWAKEEPGSIEG